MKHFFYSIAVIFTVFAFAGCIKNTNSQVAQPSDDASIVSVRIQHATYSPNASAAVFTIDNVNNRIYTVDSLPYGTKIDSLFIGFQFASSLGFIMNDTISQSNYSISAVTNQAYNFNDVVKIKNLATNGTSTKEYTIQIFVHKVETYLHVWSKLNANVSAAPTDNQKAILLNDKFYYYFGNSSANTLYTSSDATNWSETPSTGLPLNAKLRNMVVKDNAAYLLHNGNEIYTSANGQNWTQSAVNVDANYSLEALLFPFKNKLWAVALHKTNKSVKIASSADGVNWAFQGQKTFYNDFPVSDFAATVFTPALERSKVIVIGGISPSGARLKSIWSAEDLILADTLNWTSLQNPSSNLIENSDAATIYYGSRLLLLGGTTNSFAVDTTQLQQSLYQGMNWSQPDTTINRLPVDYIARTNASVVANVKDNSMYVFGGKSASGALSDVWKIKVNFYSFADYNPLNSKY